jgi:hypothetical protein
MKTPEDEAFDELARKQGAWGGGFPAKRAMAADKQEPWNEDEWRRNNWRCGHGWLRGEQCEICNAAKPAHCQCTACKDGIIHASDCAVHNGPAYPAGPCDCGPTQPADNPYGYDWSMLEAAQESLREHMARIKELEAQLAQPAQEPVAWMHVLDNTEGIEENEPEIIFTTCEENPFGVAGEDYSESYPVISQPLYTTPPQRTWVGLTDEEIEDLYFDKFSMGELKAFAKAIEAKLKEKNT